MLEYLFKMEALRAAGGGKRSGAGRGADRQGLPPCTSGRPGAASRKAASRIRRLILGLFLVTALPAAAAGTGAGAGEGSAGGAMVRGRITRETVGVAGARVYAYSRFEDLLAFRHTASSAASGADGDYLIDLPPGTYFLVARKHEGSAGGPVPVGGLSSFHGSNPFTLPPASTTEVNFSLARKLAEPIVKAGDDQGSGRIGGVVSWEGKGLEGVQVRLYLDAESAFRGAGYAAAPPTDESGAFSFDYLPESAYYIIARRRGAGVGPGPLGEGDFYGYFVDNPVRVRGGTSVEIALELVSKGRDAGNADGRPRPSGTRIAGRITDASGAVVREAYAFAYEEKVMAHKKPAFISQVVDEQGRYVIHLSRGGMFYIGARSAYGDSPGRGEWYGRYDGTPDHGVAVEAGASAEGIDIRVERILE
jgi:hypothetical protein